MRRPVMRHAVVLASVLATACAGLLAQKRTIWDGVYTTVEAARGAAAYRTTCAGCHGTDLAGNGTAPSLTAESFFFQWSDTTLNDLFTRIRTAMPPDRPDSLSPEVYRDIVAFLLESNTVAPGQVELDAAEENLRQIAITAAPR